MNLETIAWPVFKLGEKAPLRSGTVIYYGSEYYNEDTAKYSAQVKIVDDTGVAKSTLGTRRLMLENDGIALYPIRRAFYFLGDLIKVAKPTSWFIDSNGVLFQLKKSRKAKLLAFKIKNIIPSTGLGAVIELEGLPQRFKTVFKPPVDVEYAAVLKLGMSYIFYGLYRDKPKETWRLI